MKISLVVPTINRVRELERLFRSLIAQREDFEVIVVDQNPDDRLVPLVDSYRKHFPIEHLRASQKGQSRARNIGLRHIQGDIFAFPDDDCVYSDGLLTAVSRLFQDNSRWDGVITRVHPGLPAERAPGP